MTMCLGATTLMPFNVIITAVDFFSSLYGNSFSFIINFSINLPVIFVMMLLLKFGDRFSLRMRIIWPLFGDCIVLTLIPIIAICFPVSVSYPLVIIASMFAGWTQKKVTSTPLLTLLMKLMILLMMVMMVMTQQNNNNDGDDDEKQKVCFQVF